MMRLILLSLVIGCRALSVGYVDSSFADSMDYRSIIKLLDDKKIASSREKQVCPVPGTETYRGGLLKGLSWLDSASDKHPSFKAELFKGVLWNRLFETGMDSAYRRADRIFQRLSLQSPEKIEGAWFRAINMMERGKETAGVRLLDSLMKTGTNNEPLCFDFARSVLLMIAPDDQKTPPGAFPLMPDRSGPMSSGGTASSGGPPFSGVSIISDLKGHERPRFIYSWSYRLSKHWAKDQCAPGSVYLVHNSNEFLPKFVPGDLLNQLLFDETESRLEVMLDLNTPGSALQDFVLERIQGRYDSLSFRDELVDKSAISVKCFKTKAHKNEYGGYAWLIAFDHDYGDARAAAAASSADDAGRKIRCLIVLNSCINDSEKAESEFRTLLNALVRFRV